MAIWKESTSPRKEVAPPPATAVDPVHKPEFTPRVEPAQTYEPVRPAPAAARDSRESLIAPEITIEGKIEGAGHVRIAGRFKGEVNVQGNLAVENGAKLTGGVRAGTVTIGGEVEGNIESASRVELLETGVLSGDLKAASLIVAAGSRMRGQVEFGWDERPGLKAAGSKAGSTAA